MNNKKVLNINERAGLSSLTQNRVTEEMKDVATLAVVQALAFFFKQLGLGMARVLEKGPEDSL